MNFATRGTSLEQVGLSPERFAPPPVELTWVVALSPSWLHRGQRVETGQRYEIDTGTAEQLAWQGKARREPA